MVVSRDAITDGVIGGISITCWRKGPGSTPAAARRGDLAKSRKGAFSAGIPNGLDLFWYSSTSYPGPIPSTAFKNHIKHNQTDTDYYYNFTPCSAQRDIKSALRIWAGIDVLATSLPTLDPGAFAALYARVTQALQNNLAAAGPAPIASTDTQVANPNRRRLTKKFNSTLARSTPSAR